MSKLTDTLEQRGRAYNDASYQRAVAIGIPLTQELVDDTRLGSFWVRHQIAIGTGDTAIDIKLGRVPSCYIVVRNSSGGVVYDGTTPSAWTASSITLRATVAGVFSVFVG